MTESGNSRQDKLKAFADWCKKHITGDEKGEAQLFLDRLFRACDQKGILEVGGAPEMRVKKEDGGEGKASPGGTSFADYVWKPVVLIEMMEHTPAIILLHRQVAYDV